MPYIPHTEQDRREMLATIGVEAVEELFREVPEGLRYQGPLNVPAAMDERQLWGHLKGLAEKNLDGTKVACFLGAGIYDRFVPASVGAVISRGEFLTAYTPYQPEFSQGYLQTIYEFQTMVADLYGMDLANASMYDGPTSLAEGAVMATAMTKRQTVAVSDAVHPHYRQVIETYCWALGVEVRSVPVEAGQTRFDAALLDGAACLVVQSPNFFGLIEDLESARRASTQSEAMMVVSADPTSCGLLRPPGEFGADIVTGEGQPLGIAMGFGGPMLGLFATKRDYVRQIPGRIVGRTHDAQGRPGYTMTLRTREQDIRREKATSNICTNEALMALAATVYMSAVGKNGIRRVAESSVRNTQYAVARLTEAGGRLKFPGKVFCEFVLSLPKPAEEVRDALLERGVLAGLPLGGMFAGMETDLLVAVTEVRTKAEIDAYARALKEVL
jgi:glycine dehydrogenase subunit 1